MAARVRKRGLHQRNSTTIYLEVPSTIAHECAAVCSAAMPGTGNSALIAHKSLSYRSHLQRETISLHYLPTPALVALPLLQRGLAAFCWS
jgi:hypothetical protein